MTDPANPGSDPAPMASTTPPGWYPHPTTGATTWWDGAAWSDGGRPTSSGLAIAALVVGIVAFVTGLVPVLGLLAAVAGVIVGIVALVRRVRPRWMPAVGLAGSGLAAITAIIMLVVFLVALTRAPSTVVPPAPIGVPTPIPSASATPEPTPEPTGPDTSDLTLGQQNAVGAAESYLSFTLFSRQGLIDQLVFEGYSEEDSAFAVDFLEVDWNEQAAASAQSYLDISSFSRQGLIDQLLYEGYTQAEAEYGVAAVGY